MAVIKNIVTIGLLVGLVAADRLDYLRPSPLPILSSTHPAIFHTAPPTSAFPPASPLIHRAITPKPTLTSYRPISQPIQTHVHSGIGAEKIHHSPNFIPIVKESSDPNYGDGSYSYSFETGNGISASEVGVFQPGQTPEDGGQTASGSFSFTGPDNVVYSLSYTAGPEGFIPVGAHLPTPPPIPEAIQRAIQYNLAEEPSKRYSAGSAIPAYAAEQAASVAAQRYSAGSAIPAYAAEQAASVAAQRYTAAFTKQYPTYSSTTPGSPLLNKLLLPAAGSSLDYRVEENNENYTK